MPQRSTRRECRYCNLASGSVFQQPVSAGLAASFTRDDDELSIVLNSLQRRWSLGGGVRYTDTEKWQTIRENTSTDQVPVVSVDNAHTGFTIEADAFARLDASLMLGLGIPPLNTTLADIKFLELNAGPYYKASIRPPLLPSEADYIGPTEEAGLRGSAHVTLQASLFDGPLAAYIPVELDSGIRETLFDVRRPFFSSPPIGGRMECSAECNALVAGIDSATITATADTVASGTVWFSLHARDDAGEVAYVTNHGTFADREGAVVFPLPEDIRPGVYDIFPRVSLGGLSDIFPFSAYEPIASICVSGASGESGCENEVVDPCDSNNPNDCDNEEPGDDETWPPPDTTRDPSMTVDLRATYYSNSGVPSVVTLAWSAYGSPITSCRGAQGSNGRHPYWTDNTLLSTPSGAVNLILTESGTFRFWVRCFGPYGSRLSNEISISVYP